ncbi:MAG: hypothetical protein F6K19_33005 [Cyanothece sp. SIO1E1]|nr:hypothetical protein [Cyanothece sp. SIO1E1]
MLEYVKDYNGANPKFQKSSTSFKWSSLFFIDQVFGVTARVKDEHGKTLKKANSNTYIGNRLSSLTTRITNEITDGSDHKFEKVHSLPSISADDFHTEGFIDWKKNVGMPIVIKGYLNNSPILNMMTKENLISHYGKAEIKCVKIDADPGNKSSVGQNIQTVTTSLENYLSSEEFDNYYINNFYGILGEDEFLEAARGHEINTIMGKKSTVAQWFISRPKESSGSYLHCAPADNMFLNITGKKEWHFIDPSYTPIMLPAMSKFGMFCASELTESLEGEFFDDLTSRYPFFKHIPIYKTVLEEGDMLFNPPWWWHRVKNLSPLTIGCANRYVDDEKTFSNSNALFFGMLAESIKHPTRSPLNVTIRTALNRKNTSKIIDNIFTNAPKPTK